MRLLEIYSMGSMLM